ncbi:hypothetical protein, partial [Kitasatospora sp. NPDC093806]|uniref:hypothetical protein n=1 Tax=Kitasatospora sp. NPDC093806 TaxID=3155075 RepID=UPI003442AC8C
MGQRAEVADLARPTGVPQEQLEEQPAIVRRHVALAVAERFTAVDAAVLVQEQQVATLERERGLPRGQLLREFPRCAGVRAAQAGLVDDPVADPSMEEQAQVPLLTPQHIPGPAAITIAAGRQQGSPLDPPSRLPHRKSAQSTSCGGAGGYRPRVGEAERSEG